MGAIDNTCNMMYLAILLLLSVSLSVDAKRDCQKSGSSMCASSDPAMAGIPLKPCCKRFVSQEDPEKPTGDMFCMERDPILEGGSCKGRGDSVRRERSARREFVSPSQGRG